MVTVILLQEWRTGVERPPNNRKAGCSNPSRDRPQSLKQVVTTGNRCECHGSSEMTIINGFRVPQ